MVQTSEFKNGKCICPICNKTSEEKVVFKSKFAEDKVMFHCVHYRGLGAKDNQMVCVWK